MSSVHQKKKRHPNRRAVGKTPGGVAARSRSKADYKMHGRLSHRPVPTVLATYRNLAPAPISPYPCAVLAEQPKTPLWRAILPALLLVPATAPALAADNNADEGKTLKQLEAVGKRRSSDKLGETRTKRKALDEQMVHDEHDLTRYETGVSVVEGGRAGSNGFAIRGVDKDRVAINVDGLAQAESRSSEAFQELFGAYGNYNANRNTAEIENFSEVTISKGADSLKSGSGALGGAVNYKTKSAEDYVHEDKPYYLGAKAGYLSRNKQRFSSITFAGKLGGWETLLVHTRRQGAETANRADEKETKLTSDTPISSVFDNSGSTRSEKAYGVSRGKPDPQTWENQTTLFKTGYRLNYNHYLGGVFEESRLERETKELSNLWTPKNLGSEDPSGDVRHRNDVSYRRRVGFEYQGTLEKGPWDKLKLTWDKQKITMATWTWDLPASYLEKGFNSEALHMYRQIHQTTRRAALQADKHLPFARADWQIQYGGGLQTNDNDNDNVTYWVKLFAPHIATANRNDDIFLLKTRSKSRYIYWNNALSLGERRQWRLNMGVRYDRSVSRAKNDGNYTGTVAKVLPELGSSLKHGGTSYSLGVDWRPNNHLSLMAKASNGFRAPTTDELWLMFPHPDFYLKANPKLKSETARNLELGISANGKAGSFTLSGFNTRYRNFIELAYLGLGVMPFARDSFPAVVWENQNRSSAYVRGLEWKSRWQLDSIGLPKGMYTGLTATYIKGKAKAADGKSYPINALSPWSAVWNIGYDAPSKKWGAALHLSHTARKKPQDTIHSNDDLSNPWPFAKHSKSYTLADASVYRHFGRHFTLRAGVNNLTNKKYYTWAALRSIREFGTVNRVDNKTHAGIDRFTSPGRNFNVTVEARF